MKSPRMVKDIYMGRELRPSTLDKKREELLDGVSAAELKKFSRRETRLEKWMPPGDFTDRLRDSIQDDQQVRFYGQALPSLWIDTYSLRGNEGWDGFLSTLNTLNKWARVYTTERGLKGLMQEIDRKTGNESYKAWEAVKTGLGYVPEAYRSGMIDVMSTAVKASTERRFHLDFLTTLATRTSESIEALEKTLPPSGPRELPAREKDALVRSWVGEVLPALIERKHDLPGNRTGQTLNVDTTFFEDVGNDVKREWDSAATVYSAAAQIVKNHRQAFCSYLMPGLIRGGQTNWEQRAREFNDGVEILSEQHREQDAHSLASGMGKIHKAGELESWDTFKRLINLVPREQRGSAIDSQGMQKLAKAGILSTVKGIDVLARAITAVSGNKMIDLINEIGDLAEAGALKMVYTPNDRETAATSFGAQNADEIGKWDKLTLILGAVPDDQQTLPPWDSDKPAVSVCQSLLELHMRKKLRTLDDWTQIVPTKLVPKPKEIN